MFKVLCALLLSTSVLSAAEPDEKLHNQCLYPTIKIQQHDSDSSGSGVIVRSKKIDQNHYQNVIVTCAHVLKDDYVAVHLPVFKNWSDFDSWEVFEGIVYYRNDEADMAVVLFESDRALPCAKIAFNEKLFIGNLLSHIGCGNGSEPRLDDGKITGTKYYVGKSKYEAYRTSMHTMFGDSGGPAYHNYKLIGLSQAIQMTYIAGKTPSALYHISFVIPIDRLKTLNTEVNNALEFVYREERPMPRLAFDRLRLSLYSVGE